MKSGFSCLYVCNNTITLHYSILRSRLYFHGKVLARKIIKILPFKIFSLYSTDLYSISSFQHKVSFYCTIQVLRLSHSTIGRLSIGHIVNLASTDVQRFDLVCETSTVKQKLLYFCSQGFEFFHMWWVFVISMPIMTYLLWRELGPSCLIGVCLIIIQPPLQYALARLYTRLWYV